MLSLGVLSVLSLFVVMLSVVMLGIVMQVWLYRVSLLLSVAPLLLCWEPFVQSFVIYIDMLSWVRLSISILSAVIVCIFVANVVMLSVSMPIVVMLHIFIVSLVMMSDAMMRIINGECHHCYGKSHFY